MAQVIFIVTTLAAGHTDINPVGGSITMTRKTLAIDQRFGQPGSAAVKRLPILNHSS